jgi:hypothetical protein
LENNPYAKSNVYSSESSEGSTKGSFDIKYPNDIIGLDRFWQENGSKVQSYYAHSDVSTNTDINKLIESMLTIGTNTKNARPSSKRLLSKLRKIIFNYNLSQKHLTAKRQVILPVNTELDALTPV